MGVLLRHSLTALSATTLLVVLGVAPAALAAVPAGIVEDGASAVVVDADTQESVYMAQVPPSNGNGTGGSEPAGTRGRG